MNDERYIIRWLAIFIIVVVVAVMTVQLNKDSVPPPKPPSTADADMTFRQGIYVGYSIAEAGGTKADVVGIVSALETNNGAYMQQWFKERTQK